MLSACSSMGGAGPAGCPMTPWLANTSAAAVTGAWAPEATNRSGTKEAAVRGPARAAGAVYRIDYARPLLHDCLGAARSAGRVRAMARAPGHEEWAEGGQRAHRI